MTGKSNCALSAVQVRYFDFCTATHVSLICLDTGKKMELVSFVGTSSIFDTVDITCQNAQIRIEILITYMLLEVFLCAYFSP